MTRTFIHNFQPASASPVTGPTVDLNISEIEDAGIREVLQTPGAAYGSWSILDALLTATGPGTPFVFKEPLGQAREVKVALSGLGGDELFGGYPSFRDVPRLKPIARLSRPLRRVLGSVAGMGDRLSDLPRNADAGELARWRRRFFTDDMIRRAGLPLAPAPFECPVELPDDFARVSWAELTGYMRRMLLRDADQMSMAVSLELRVPFLDHELVEYVLGLPAEAKKRYPGPKGLLVEACRDLLPPSVYDRPKAGFVLPMKAWMLGPLASFVEEGLRETVSRHLLPQAFVNEISGAFQRGRLHWTRAWSIVVLGHFAKRTQLFRSPDEDTPIHPHG